MNPNRTRVLLGSPIHQKPAILEQFLNSLLRLNLKDIDLDFYLIDDNPDEAASQLLQQFARTADPSSCNPPATMMTISEMSIRMSGIPIWSGRWPDSRI